MAIIPPKRPTNASNKSQEASLRQPKLPGILRITPTTPSPKDSTAPPMPPNPPIIPLNNPITLNHHLDVVPLLYKIKVTAVCQSVCFARRKLPFSYKLPSRFLSFLKAIGILFRVVFCQVVTIIFT